MRMISSTTPKVSHEMGDFRLDALEILPCGTSESDTVCLLVRYFNYENNDVEGDHLFLTIEEALSAAYDEYGVDRCSWIGVPDIGNKDPVVLFQSVLDFNVAKQKQSGRQNS